MAVRDLGRNRRRTLLSAFAVTIGMFLVLLIASFLRGEMEGALKTSILLQTGDLQVRGASYNEDKVSLEWKDLIAAPEDVAAQIGQIPQVASATPRLIASGILTLRDNSRGVQVIGIDPQAQPNQVFREGILAGEFLTPDDREGILIGKPLADKFKVQAGDQVSLLVNTSDGSTDEQPFIVRGIYSTNTSAYDQATVFMPMAKAQAITGAQDHASVIFVLLRQREDADAVAAALQSPGYQVLTWRQQNALIVQFEDMANSYMFIFYLIVLGITATVVTNTLVMSVFERTREIGILAAIGMKGRRIMMQFLTEAGLIATGGIIVGLILGVLAAAYLGVHGYYVGGMGIGGTGSGGMLVGDNIYARLTFPDAVNLTIATYIIVLIASLYPAIMAARMEPVEALHAQ
jgi:ABC-type lipoprotein release transport system permease subunit